MSVSLSVYLPACHCGGAVALSVPPPSQTEGLVFESQTRQTKVVKTGSDSPTAKCSAIVESVTDPRI